jgi:predicted patatin/cPLA2 family phospholipase
MEIVMDAQLQSRIGQAAQHLPFEVVALVLQGGGALRAYQAGVYEALSEAGIEPNWIAGMSIGAHVRFGSKADIAERRCHVRFTPKADITQRSAQSIGVIIRSASPE